ncbi:MAG: putative Ig domain-containing protein [Thermoanaerobaculia bacterium]
MASFLVASGAFAQCPVIAISPASLSNATSGQVYGPVAFSALPASAYTFDATGLPTGLTMSVGGSLSGTPTQNGTFAVRTVATSAASCVATHIIPLTVVCPAITVNPATMPNGLVGIAYPNQTMAGVGGTAPYTFAVTSGALPPGLTLSAGVVSGTPTTTVGSPFNFTITGTDANGCTGSRAYTVAIGTCPTITVTNPGVVNGTSGSPYTTAAFTQAGATTPSFTIGSGTLPIGLSLNPGTGIISGTPTQTGTFSVTVKATTSTGANTGCSGTGATYTFQICPVVTVTAPTRQDGVVNAAIPNVTFTQSGATTPNFTVASGSLPAGMTLGLTTGVLGGTPTATGTFSITVKATDTAAGTNGCNGTSATYTFQICPVISVTAPSRQDGVVNSAIPNVTFTQTGATTPNFIVATGSLPAGMTLGLTTGILGGTPTASGTFSITVKVTDTAAGTNGCNATSATYTFQICPVITVTRTGGGAFPQATFNVAYAGQSFTAAGGTAPYTFTVTAGTFPTGLTLAAAGTISGSPTAVGTFSFTVTATSAAGSPACTGAAAFSIAVGPRAVTDTYSNLVPNTQAVVTGGTTGSPATPFVPIAFASRITVNDQSDQAITLTTGTFATTAVGSVTVAADGTFIYTPPITAAALAADSFSYTITSNAVSTVGTVNLTLANRVWYINPAAALSGDGRSNTPWNNTNLIAGTTASDILFVYSGNTANLQTKITLLANQTLWGQGVALVVNTFTLVAAGAAPTITNSVGATPRDVVAVNNGNLIQGVTLTTTDTNAGANAASLVKGSPIGLTTTTSTLNVPSGTAHGINLAATAAGVISLTATPITLASNGTAFAIGSGTGNVTLTTSPISHTGAGGTGIAVNGRTSGTVSFPAAVSVTGGGSTGINLTTNTGATINFAGTLTLTTTTGPAFVATGGGTVTATGTGSVASTTTAIAVNVLNTTIGAGALTFQAVNANGSANGINLTNTGSSAGLTVTGTGAVDSGGVIQNTSGSAIVANNTQNLSLTRIRISNPATGGGHGIDATNLRGTCLLDTSTIADFVFSTSDGISITNNNTNLTKLTITGSTFNGSDTGNAGVFMEAQGTSNMTLSVEGNSLFTDMFGDGLHASTITGASGTVNVTVKDSTFNNAAVLGNGGVLFTPFGGPTNFTFSVINNTFDTIMRPITNLGAISITDGDLDGGGPTMNGTIQNNTLNNIIGSRAITLIADTFAGPMTLLVDNNTINRLGSTTKHAINIGTRDNVVGAKVTVTNNMIGQAANLWTSGSGTAEAVLLLTQQSSSMNALIQGNIVTANATLEVMRVRAIGSSTLNATINGGNNLSDTSGAHIEFGAATGTGAVVGGNICLNMSGNTVPAAGVGVIQISENAAPGNISVTQASAAAVAAANNGATVTVTGTPAFGQPSCPLP